MFDHRAGYPTSPQVDKREKINMGKHFFCHELGIKWPPNSHQFGHGQFSFPLTQTESIQIPCANELMNVSDFEPSARVELQVMVACIHLN
jgi:hypothetical protein